MAPKYEYVHVENSIKAILKGGVTLTKEEKKEYNEYLQMIFGVLECEMKKNSVFSVLFRQKQYVGSFYENLKIHKPDEFDIDFELWVPPDIGILQVCESEQPGSCQLKFFESTSQTSDPKKADAKKQLKKWIDDEGFILRSKVNAWMQGLVQVVLNKYEENYEQKTFKITIKTSGPAVTLIVTLIEHPELQLSLDLVPVFVFSVWPDIYENLRKWESEMEEQKWYAVPKPNDSERDFRLCFWHQEKRLINDTNQMKPVLKMIKKLKEIQQWKGISSYYVKTMFLWKTHANGKNYWRKGLGETFIEMLKELQDYLQNQRALPFFWMKELDLFSKLDPEEKDNIGYYLQRMIKKIMDNLSEPGFLERYFIRSDSTMNQSAELLPLETSTVVQWNDFQSTSHERFESFPLETSAVVRRNTSLGTSHERFESSPLETSAVVRRNSSLGTVNRNSQSRTRQDENNTGAIVAATAVGVGVAALVGVALFSAFRNSRQARD